MRILFAVLLLATFAAASDDEPIDVGTPIIVGEELPEIRLPTIDGGRLTTNVFEIERRRGLLIEFASW